MQEKRKDPLTAQKVDIGLIFSNMLGVEDARAYLNSEGVSIAVIERVTSGRRTRRGHGELSLAPAAPDSHLHSHFYSHSGRRRDTVKAAVVQAAIAVSAPLGRERAERLLRRELLPEEVIARVLAEDGASRRGRSVSPRPA
jgi:hypothetical protein